jgi:predicted enzyme related to lactoylglutathione lyase
VTHIEVDSLQRSLAKVEAQSGSVEANEQAINDAAGRFVLVRDPDGNLLGLWAS